MKPNPQQNLRTEQQFFEDPAIDRLMGTVMALATEVFVLQNRVSDLESLLAKSELVDTDLLPEAAGADHNGSIKAEAKAFAEALLKPVLGLQDAAGSPE